MYSPIKVICAFPKWHYYIILSKSQRDYSERNPFLLSLPYRVSIGLDAREESCERGALHAFIYSFWVCMGDVKCCLKGTSLTFEVFVTKFKLQNLALSDFYEKKKKCAFSISSLFCVYQSPLWDWYFCYFVSKVCAWKSDTKFCTLRRCVVSFYGRLL